MIKELKKTLHIKNIKIYNKIKNILNILFNEKPKIVLENGSFVDFKNNKFYFVGDFSLHINGNLYIKADKHICINSGCTDEERKGYKYSVWINTELNEKNLPLKREENEPRFKSQ